MLLHNTSFAGAVQALATLDNLASEHWSRSLAILSLKLDCQIGDGGGGGGGGVHFIGVEPYRQEPTT